MRRIIGLSVAAIMVLAGCGSDSNGSDAQTPTPSVTPSDPVIEASPEDLAALDRVTVTGGDDEKFVISIDGEATVNFPVAKLLRAGDGADLVDGHQLMFDGSLFDAKTGEELNTSFGSPVGRIVAGNTVDQMTESMHEVLAGQKVGAQLLWIMPADTPETNGYIYVLQAVDTWAPKERADGEAVTPPAGLPEVSLDADGKPSISIPATEAPTELIVQTLIKGDGPPINEGNVETGLFNQVTFNYTGWKWSGEQFDSSWDRGQPFASAVGQQRLITAWDEGLIGQTVGSQVLIIAPPSAAYGGPGSVHELKDDTLIFVLDILDIR